MKCAIVDLIWKWHFNLEMVSSLIHCVELKAMRVKKCIKLK